MTQEYQDLSDLNVFIGISGGINSAAALVYLAKYHPEHLRPKRVFAFYAHLTEHSPGTLTFVRHLVAYGKRMFPSFTFGCSVGSVNKYFRDERMIPHPTLSPCSENLKIIPIMKFKGEHNIDVDIVGYVHGERRRMNRQQGKATEPGKYYYPIIEWTDERCLEEVKAEIGRYPAIYDIKDDRGKRVFTHNNCLVCKNMTGVLLPDGTATRQYATVLDHYPFLFYTAQQTAVIISAKLRKPVYWGRKRDMPDEEAGCSDYVCE